MSIINLRTHKSHYTTKKLSSPECPDWRTRLIHSCHCFFCMFVDINLDLLNSTCCVNHTPLNFRVLRLHQLLERSEQIFNEAGSRICNTLRKQSRVRPVSTMSSTTRTCLPLMSSSMSFTIFTTPVLLVASPQEEMLMITSQQHTVSHQSHQNLAL